jgi:hypothetical protein
VLPPYITLTENFLRYYEQKKQKKQQKKQQKKRHWEMLQQNYCCYLHRWTKETRALALAM